MAIHKPCPRCQAPLEIAQPCPEQIRCDKCGAIINNRPASSANQEGVTAKAPYALPVAAHAPPASEPQHPVPGVSRFKVAILAGLLAGLLLICLLPIAGIGLAWVFSGKEKSPEKTDSPVQNLVEPEIEPKGPPPMPPEIRKAIDRGVAHLKKRMLEKGGTLGADGAARYADSAPVGRSALVGLTLLEAKVPPDDPAIKQALADVRAGAPNLNMIYALGTALFFLNRLDEAAPLDAPDRELARRLALRIIAGQLPDGRWSYYNPPITPIAEKDLLQKLHSNQYKPQGTLSTHPSHSMTQFALLALWGSRRHDIPARPAILASAARFHVTQNADGTWDYNVNWGIGKIVHDSNTCAGLIALAMEKTLREDKGFQDQIAGDPPANPKADEQCVKAFAHLAKVIGRTKNDPTVPHQFTGTIIRADAWGDYYFLWCLERAAVIYDLETIGGKDWYGWGSKVILDSQKEDGSWVDRHGDVCDTCFAILFLTRANLAKDLTRSIRTRAGKAAIP